MDSRYILGVSFFYHDSAAVLLKDGLLIAAAQEERFTRVKHDDAFPQHAIDYVLRQASITREQLAYVAFYEKPFMHFERILRTFIKTWPRGLASFFVAMPVWLKEKLWVRSLLKKEFGAAKVVFVDHHVSHAASTFLCSPFRRAAILTMDGVGEWATTTYGVGEGGTLKLQQQISFPNSLGLFYSALTYYLGFKVNSAEYKVMGLAPHGQPKYMKQMRELLRINKDGSYSLNQKYFGYTHGLKMINRAFVRLFDRPVREPESAIEQFHKDVACSLQKITEEAVLKMADCVYDRTHEDNLCLAGGVALNCVANGRILREGKFKNIFIQPAAGDAGGALGAALYLENSILANPRRFTMDHVYWGPSFADGEIEAFLKAWEVPYERFDRGDLVGRAAEILNSNGVLGWFQGRMEFGPRALGNRSILADARDKTNWQRVNLKIKFRESFRPFAPSVIAEDAIKYFDLPVPSPYMLLVAQVQSDDIPAVTHVDGSARVQTVSRETNALYYDLLAAFKAKTACSVLINTSFNVRGEPIVCTPTDAFKCFMRTDMDYLIMGSFLLDKKQMTNVSRVYMGDEKMSLD